MSEVEKTNIFWWGTVILGISVTILFTSIWLPYGRIMNYRVSFEEGYGVSEEPYVPWTFGSVIFMYIGWYMMKNGTKKKEVGKIQPLNQKLS
jgi:hypothetical protein